MSNTPSKKEFLLESVDSPGNPTRIPLGRPVVVLDAIRLLMAVKERNLLVEIIDVTKDVAVKVNDRFVMDTALVKPGDLLSINGFGYVVVPYDSAVVHPARHLHEQRERLSRFFAAQGLSAADVAGVPPSRIKPQKVPSLSAAADRRPFKVSGRFWLYTFALVVMLAIFLSGRVLSEDMPKQSQQDSSLQSSAELQKKESKSSKGAAEKNAPLLGVTRPAPPEPKEALAEPTHSADASFETQPQARRTPLASTLKGGAAGNGRVKAHRPAPVSQVQARRQPAFRRAEVSRARIRKYDGVMGDKGFKAERLSPALAREFREMETEQEESLAPEEVQRVRKIIQSYQIRANFAPEESKAGLLRLLQEVTHPRLRREIQTAVSRIRER
jgi:hypothetical protein